MRQHAANLMSADRIYDIAALRVSHHNRPQICHSPVLEHLTNYEPLLPIACPPATASYKPVVIGINGLGPCLPGVVPSSGMSVATKVGNAHMWIA